MITMSHMQLRTLNFALPLVKKLFNTPMPGQSAMRLKTLMSALGKESERINAISQDILSEEKWAKKNEEGKVMRPDGNAFDYVVDPEKAEEFQKVRDEFENATFTLDMPKLSTKDILPWIQLSVTELEILSPILEPYTEHQPPAKLRAVEEV